MGILPPCGVSASAGHAREALDVVWIVWLIRPEDSILDLALRLWIRSNCSGLHRQMISLRDCEGQESMLASCLAGMGDRDEIIIGIRDRPIGPMVAAVGAGVFLAEPMQRPQRGLRLTVAGSLSGR
jgi:hypothetical protein